MPRLSQIKGYEIGICCFSAKHAAVRSKRNDWLSRNLTVDYLQEEIRSDIKDDCLDQICCLIC